jgi:sugar lactone lactonase YvrE
MVITPDGRTLIISEPMVGRLTAFGIDGDAGCRGGGCSPDGICMDAEGAVWVSTGGFAVARVAEGGKVLQRVELAENRAPSALMPGAGRPWQQNTPPQPPRPYLDKAAQKGRSPVAVIGVAQDPQ